MSFARYAILVLLLVVLGLITVWEHLRLLSTGYEMNELRARRVRLEEEVRVQEHRIDAIAAPGETAARVKALGLDLAPWSSHPAPDGRRRRSGRAVPTRRNAADPERTGGGR